MNRQAIRTASCLALLLALVLTCGNALADTMASAEANAADSRLEKLMDQFWDAELASRPLTANMFGSPEYRDRLPDLSEEAFADRRRRLDTALETLQGIDMIDLSEANRINYRIFEWMLRKERRTLDFDWQYVTFNTMGGQHSLFAEVVLALPYRSETDFRALLTRLEGFGTLIDQTIALEKKGIESAYVQPCEVLDGHADSIIGWATERPEDSAFYSLFQQMPETLDWARREELRSAAKRVIAESVNPAFERYHAFFNETYQPNCRQQIGISSLPQGKKLYQHFVTYYTSLETSAEAVHELGLQEVARIREEMLAVKEEAGFEGSLASFRKFLQTDPQFYLDDPERYMQYVARITKEADRRMPDFFAVLPRNAYGILEVPAQTAPQTTTAYYQPGAADGSRAGVYFVNTYDLASRPLYELPALSVHEAVPGHHHQISIQQELPRLPDFRRLYYFHAFGEGWGLYTEKLGIEMGMYRTPYEHFGRLIYEMWRATRLVVDTGMHAKGWTRQQAIDYMMEFTGLTLRNVTAEVNRYITYPGQALAYKHGELKILEIRRRAETALGENFDLRTFHSALLGNGSMPLTVLDDLMNEWIAEQQE